MTYLLVDEDTAEPMEEDNSSSGATCSSSSAPHLQPLPTSSSSESVYESCVSQQSPMPVASSPPSPLTATSDSTSQKSPFVTCEDDDRESLDTHRTTKSRESAGSGIGSPEAQKGETATVMTKPTSRIPVLRLVKSPLPNQRFSGPKSPTPASPRDSLGTSPLTSSLETTAPSLATTHVKSHQEKMSLIIRDSPMNATYRVSPVGVPYLSKGHTPKTIQQLQEKLRSQTKGKLISLEELRNARSAIYVSIHDS